MVRHNVAHAERTGRFDVHYATGLLADAVSTLVSALPRLDPDTKARALAVLCASRPQHGGWLTYNASVDAAEVTNRGLPGGGPLPLSQGPYSSWAMSAGRVVKLRTQDASVCPSMVRRQL